jgi:hypothetical protein
MTNCHPGPIPRPLESTAPRNTTIGADPASTLMQTVTRIATTATAGGEGGVTIAIMSSRRGGGGTRGESEQGARSEATILRARATRETFWQLASLVATRFALRIILTHYPNPLLDSCRSSEDEGDGYRRRGSDSRYSDDASNSYDNDGNRYR